MNAFYGLGMIFLANGILSFVGMAVVPKGFENQPWIKEYKRKLGMILLLFSGVYFILDKVVPLTGSNFWTTLVLVFVLSAPVSAVRCFFLDKKYKKRLAAENKTDNT